MNKARKNIYIDENLWFKLKVHAAKEKTSISEIIEKLVKEKLIAEGELKEEGSVL